MTTIRRIGLPEPIYFIGDSSTMAFRNRLYREESGDRTFIGRCIYLPGLYAADMCDASGRVHPQIISNLVTESLLFNDHLGDWAAFHTDLNSETRFIASVTGSGDEQPAIVFSLGGYDAIRLLEQFGEAEIHLPDWLPPIPGKRSWDIPNYSFDEVCAIARPYVEPYERAITKLRSYGLTNIFLHDLPPSGEDDAEFARYFSIASNIRSRHQCYIVINYLVREFAERLGISYIDLWPQVMLADGNRNPRFARDGVHLNNRAAMLTIRTIVERLTAGGRPAVKPVRPRAATAPSVPSEPNYDFEAIAQPVFEDVWG